MRTLERKKSSAGRLTATSAASHKQQHNGGGEKNEFDDLISALRTGDVFEVRSGRSGPVSRANRAVKDGHQQRGQQRSSPQRTGSFLRERGGRQ